MQYFSDKFDDKKENEEESDEKKYPNLPAAKLQDIEDIFKQFDKDGDDLISFFDLGNMMRWLQFNPT